LAHERASDAYFQKHLTAIVIVINGIIYTIRKLKKGNISVVSFFAAVTRKFLKQTTQKASPLAWSVVRNSRKSSTRANMKDVYSKWENLAFVKNMSGMHIGERR
jgi:hypothetical protein